MTRLRVALVLVASLVLLAACRGPRAPHRDDGRPPPRPADLPEPGVVLRGS